MRKGSYEKKEVLKLIEVLVLHSLFCLYIRVERNALQRIKVTGLTGSNLIAPILEFFYEKRKL